MTSKQKPEKIISLGIMSEEQFQNRFKNKGQVQSLGKMTEKQFQNFKEDLLSKQGEKQLHSPATVII